MKETQFCTTTCDPETIAAFRALASATNSSEWDEKLIDQAPSSLQNTLLAAAGYENGSLQLELCRNAGISNWRTSGEAGESSTSDEASEAQ